MRRAILSIATFWLGMLALLLPLPAKAASDGPGIAVVDFGYHDTSGELKDQTAEHQKRLAAFMQGLREDLTTHGAYRLVPIACTPVPCVSGVSDPAMLRESARKAGAKLLLIGAIHKMSTLVQWAKVMAVDVDTGHVVFDKLLTFRGDTDASWRRTEKFVAGEFLTSHPGRSAAAETPKLVAARPRAQAPIKLAYFPFELDDFSAGAAVTAGSAQDTTYLRDVTRAVRDLLTQSGRYSFVDTAEAAASQAKKGVLWDCHGCDAAIAAKLGAQQSFIGVITRISRTEFAVTVKIRDAKTGALLAEQQSGLLVGADYAWSRGAMHLLRTRLLAHPTQL